MPAKPDLLRSERKARALDGSEARAWHRPRAALSLEFAGMGWSVASIWLVSERRCVNGLDLICQEMSDENLLTDDVRHLRAHAPSLVLKSYDLAG